MAAQDVQQRFGLNYLFTGVDGFIDALSWLQNQTCFLDLALDTGLAE